ncbi:hypothetical protein ACLOAV_010844 [Pseudogymnoascus australis]
MRASGTIIAVVSTLSLASAIPTASLTKLASRADPADDPRGNYIVSGLGARKQEVTGAGADTLALAVAMLETDNMSTTYAYGDNKQDDASNFGIFKQNWGMLRECCTQFQGLTEADWNNGAVLNTDLNADVACLNECRSYYGVDKWLGGHRDGSTGLADPTLEVVVDYKAGIEWIQAQIEANPTGLTDDTRFWVQIQAI